jgi:hypothetical protein
MFVINEFLLHFQHLRNQGLLVAHDVLSATDYLSGILWLPANIAGCPGSGHIPIGQAGTGVGHA